MKQPIETWYKMCAGKSRYPSQHRANQFILKRKQATGVQLYCYHCPVCDSWHLTKQPKKQGQQRVLTVCRKG